MNLNAEQMIYLMEVAAKNADAYGMKPLELFNQMKNRLEMEEISDGKANDQGTESDS